MLYDADGNFAGGMCDGGQGSVHLAEIMVKRTVSVPCISVALLVVLLLFSLEISKTNFLKVLLNSVFVNCFQTNSSVFLIFFYCF